MQEIADWMKIIGGIIIVIAFIVAGLQMAFSKVPFTEAIKGPVLGALIIGLAVEVCGWLVA